jgi:RNA polymerase sigma-70 factor (ECF subfamily)
MFDLAERLKSGDTKAFELLFSRNERLVYRTAYLITGDREEAKDVLQEVFVAVWKWRHTFNPERGKFTTWLHRITVNECSKRHKKRRIAFLSLEKVENKGYCSDETTELPEDIMISREEHNRLMKALGSLDTKHRSVLVLRFFNELSYDEIASVVGISLGTVKSRIHYALKTLREELAT